MNEGRIGVESTENLRWEGLSSRGIKPSYSGCLELPGLPGGVGILYEPLFSHRQFIPGAIKSPPLTLILFRVSGMYSQLSDHCWSTRLLGTSSALPDPTLGVLIPSPICKT